MAAASRPDTVLAMLDAFVSGRSGTRRSRRLPLALLVLAAGLLAALMTVMVAESPARKVDLLDEKISLAYGPANYGEAQAELDRQRALANERIDRDPGQWTYQEHLAVTSLIRAQLTGAFEDYRQASDAIDTSMQIAPEGGGPAMTDAIVNLSLHRYPAAGKDIDLISGFAVAPGDDERAEMLAGRGDIAFYSGNYAKAFALYTDAAALDKGPRTLFRLATWHKYNGRFDRAIALYERGAGNAKVRTPQMLSAYLLQIGALELQRGNWELARRYFVRADAVFSGYWLAEAHLAQMLAVEGRLAEAEQAYLAIIDKTANPDVMMALAALYDHRGDRENSARWMRRAGALMDIRVAALPEAYYDHALDFAIANDDRSGAMDLASLNHQARPYGDAAMALARAHLLNGRSKSAVDILKKVEASGWKSVEQYLILAEAYERSGQTRLSAKAMDAALAINPKADDPQTGLLAFGNH